MVQIGEAGLSEKMKMAPVKEIKPIEEEKKKDSVFGTESEAEIAKDLFEGKKEEKKTVYRAQESQVANLIVLLMIIAGSVAVVALLYYLFYLL